MLYPAISIDGCTITPDTLDSWEKGRVGIQADLAAFLREWWSPHDAIPLQTSGSTGKPKTISASKEAMCASAAATCRAFELKAGDSALLCLPLRYIAGKMMVVRAMVGGLRLITAEPSSTPLAAVDTTIDFAPLVPMQLSTTLASPRGMEEVSRVRTILLGGGFVDAKLEAQLQTLPCRIYTSYGMTETLSHIALRAANGSLRSEWYTPLPGVTTGISPAGTLYLSVPYLGIDHLTTNDLAERTDDGRFRILGRADAVINSGGIKIQAEDIERELTSRTGLQVLAVPMPHPMLGQCVALLWEGPEDAYPSLLAACKELPRYHRPHHVLRAVIPRTETGKTARAKARDIIILNPLR